MYTECNTNKRGYNLIVDAIKCIVIFFVLWVHCIQLASAGCYDYFSDSTRCLAQQFSEIIFKIANERKQTFTTI